MTYPLQIKKIARGDASGKVLPGAEFKVYRENGDTQLKFTKVSDTEYKVDPDGSVDAIVTVAEAPLTILGLNAENYILEETQAPQGYNLLESSLGGSVVHLAQIAEDPDGGGDVDEREGIPLRLLPLQTHLLLIALSVPSYLRERTRSRCL